MSPSRIRENQLVRLLGGHISSVFKRLRLRARFVWPPIGMVRWGSFRRLSPIDRRWWFRGMPVDRYYIEGFLEGQSGTDEYVLGDIRGSVLEVGDEKYTRRFGNFHEGPGDAPPGCVTSLDVLHADDSNPVATVVGDLVSGDGIPSDAYDCVICTQTLLVIYDVHAAVRNLHRMLKPGGVLLLTVPGISQLCRPDMDLWGDYWRFTSLAVRRMLEEVFPAENVTVESHGNVRVATAYLYGLAVEDLRPQTLDLHDPDYEVVITGRAVKASA
jgi:SAM-dependent methyltransferase